MKRIQRSETSGIKPFQASKVSQKIHKIKQIHKLSFKAPDKLTW